MNSLPELNDNMVPHIKKYSFAHDNKDTNNNMGHAKENQWYI